MARRSKYTREVLAPLVEASLSWAQVIHKLGLKLTGGNYRNIQAHVRHHGLSTEHFTGQGWRHGHTKETHQTIHLQAKRKEYTPDEVFIENFAGASKARTLRKMMLLVGFEYRCANGHEPYWMGEPLTLHVDHINGINNDNRMLNLRFLCPNCHQQTKTWGKKGKNGASGGTRTHKPEALAPKTSVYTNSTTDADDDDDEEE